MIKFSPAYFLSLSLAICVTLFAGCGQNGQEAESPDDFAPATGNDNAQADPSPEPQEDEPEPEVPLPSGSGAQAEQPAEWPPLHLQQVIPGERAAVIDGEVVFEGDQIEGITLRAVESDGVILQRGTNIVFLARGATLEPDPEDGITGTEEIPSREGDITGSEEFPSREGDVTGSEEEDETAEGE